MKFKITKEWILEKIKDEEGFEIGAGSTDVLYEKWKEYKKLKVERENKMTVLKPKHKKME